MQALVRGKPLNAELSQPERALFEYVKQVTESVFRATADNFRILREHWWTDPQIAETVQITALFACFKITAVFACFNRVADLLGVPK
jgi:hypothetical protein